MKYDVKNMSAKEREKLKKAIEDAEEAEKNAYKKEFVADVVKTAIDKGIKWSEALTLFSDHKPESDAEAKKLGYTQKKTTVEKTDEGSKTIVKYYFRQVSGSEVL